MNMTKVILKKSERDAGDFASRSEGRDSKGSGMQPGYGLGCSGEQQKRTDCGQDPGVCVGEVRKRVCRKRSKQ